MSNVPSFLGVVHAGDNEFKKFATLQSWLQQACINAGISLVSSNPQLVLDQIRAGDTDLQKWQKVTSWAQQLASGIAGGGGLPPANVTTVTASSNLPTSGNSFTTVNSASSTNQALPPSPQAGQQCIVKSIGAGLATVTSTSANIFAGSAVSTYLVGSNGQAATFTWDGTYWEVT